MRRGQKKKELEMRSKIKGKWELVRGVSRTGEKK